MRYFIIAGEPSGDLHGSRLMREISRIDPSAEFMGMGGDMMEDAGLKLIAHIRDQSLMGFWEVLKKIFSIQKLMNQMLEELEKFNPDRVILIDYGGFNLRMAKKIKRKNRKVYYYILPKVWAWNQQRVKKIRKYVDFAYVIFPFEENWFKKHGVNAQYVGNPVVSSVDDYLSVAGRSEPDDKTIALLPGSRKQEIERILPVMMEVAKRFGNYRFILAMRSKDDLPSMRIPENVQVESGNTYHVIQKSRAAIVTSGTANLETALLGTPQVVVYKANPLSYAIGKKVVKIKYISPVNLILNRKLVSELIQSDCNAITLEQEIESLLNQEYSKGVKKGYERLIDILTNKNASKVCAEHICSNS